MRICDLRQKEVINIRDCQRLGYVADIDFDVCTGCICQLIVPGPAKFCGFSAGKLNIRSAGAALNKLVMM